MQNEARLAARDALFTAIKNSAENNMKAALRATEKAEILRALAYYYRLTVGDPAASSSAGSRSAGSRSGGSRSADGGKPEAKARSAQPVKSAKSSKSAESSGGGSRSGESDDKPRKRRSADDDAPRKPRPATGTTRKRPAAR